MGRALHVEVVAEGVEHLYQLNRLRELGCEFAQGYYLSRPLRAERSRRCWMHPARRRRGCGPRDPASGSRRARATTARSPRSSQVRCHGATGAGGTGSDGTFGPSSSDEGPIPLSGSRRTAYTSRATRLLHRANPSKGGDAKPGIFGERHSHRPPGRQTPFEAHRQVVALADVTARRKSISFGWSLDFAPLLRARAVGALLVALGLAVIAPAGVAAADPYDPSC